MVKNNPDQGTKVLNNTVWMIIQSILTMLISLVIGSISARYLGPSNYGLISYGASIITLLSPICSLGMQTMIIDEIVKHPEDEGMTVGTGMLTRFLASFGAIGIITVIIRIIEPNQSLLVYLTFLQSLSLIFLSYEVLTYWFQAKLLAKYIAIATVLASIVVGCWKIILLVLNASVSFFAMSATIQATVMMVSLIIIFKKHFKGKISFSFKHAKYLLSKSYHMILASIGIAIYGQTDRIMIGYLCNNTALGYYTAAYTITVMWCFIPQAICNSMRPVIFSANVEDGSYDRKSRFMYASIILIGILAGIGFILFGRIILRLLYGAEYMAGLSTLYILAWVGLLSQLSTGISIWCVGRGLYKYIKHFTIIGAVSNIILNALFIPLWGIAGAAVGTVGAQIMVNFVIPLLFKETRPCVREIFLSVKEIPAVIKTGLFYLQKVIKRI